jgi:hypothetical protein
MSDLRSFIKIAISCQSIPQSGRRWEQGNLTDTVYNLVGVVAHVGTLDDGHYFSVVQWAHSDWYFCDDTDVELFDLSSLPRRAFGVCREGAGEVSVADLLFYARAGMALHKPNIPRDLEVELNSKNQETWPQVIFSSDRFIRYVQDILRNYPQSKNALELGILVFIRISIPSEAAWRFDTT